MRGTSWYGGGSVAAHERVALGERLDDLRATWARETGALADALPTITSAAAPYLDATTKARLDRALLALLSAEIAHLASALDSGDSLVAMMATTPKIDAAMKLVAGGFKPLLDLTRTIASTIGKLAPRVIPAVSTQTPTVPLVALARDGKAALTHIARAIMAAQVHAPLLAETIARNIAVVTGQDPNDTSRALTAPHSLDGDAANVAILVFADTGLLEILLTPIPLVVPMETRYRHTHIVAGAGWGKTQLLQHQIAQFLQQPNPPAMILIDSQGDMLDLIARLQVFAPGKGRLADKLVIIDPRDIGYPSALNLFAVNAARHAAMTPAQREQTTNSLLWLYEIIFRAMLNAELTQKQQLLFRFLARLMLAIPGATIITLRAALEDLTPFRPYIAQLGSEAQNFLNSPIVTKDFKETSEQVWRRLYGILKQPTFARMFSTPDRKLDLYDCMQAGKIVLVNTAKDFLSPENSVIFGRTFVAFTLQAAIERANIPREQRYPAFLFLDEASETLDSSAQKILETARKYNVGLVAAHQQLDQLQPGVRAALASNTAIKMAGGVSDADAHAMAREMRCEPADIRALDRTDRSTTFMTYIDGVTARAVPLVTPFFTLEAMPKMTSAEHAQVIAANRRRYCQAPPTAPPRGSDPPRPGASPAPPPVQPGKGRAAPKTPRPAIPKHDDDWRS